MVDKSNMTNRVLRLILFVLLVQFPWVLDLHAGPGQEAASGSSSNSSRVFKLDEEFPNYFKELPPEIAQEKIQKAMDSILRRLEVPHVEDGSGASTEKSKTIKADNFFLKVRQKVEE